MNKNKTLIWKGVINMARCSQCNGYGRVGTCPTCKGTGRKPSAESHRPDSSCPTCKGTGKNICENCNGTGDRR